MTDNTAWTPPSNAGASTPTPASPFAPEDGPAAPAAGNGAPGWTPPPKPGLIPLRPLTLGVLLGAAFQVLRRNPRPTFGFALLITGTVSIVAVVVVGLVAAFAFSRTLTASDADAATLGAGAVALTLLATLVVVVFSIVASAMLQGVISLEVARATLGEKLKLGGLWKAARGRIGALIGWTLALVGAATIAVAIVAVLIAVIVAVGGVAGVVIGVLLGLIAGAGALVLWAWLSTRLSLVPSALMLERLPLRDAVRRSWSLTTGFFWKTFGTLLLVGFIIYVVNSVITAPLSILGSFTTSLLNPNGDPTASLTAIFVIYGLTLVVSIVFGAIAAVVQSATPALIYIDLRMRKEGLDLELSRFVEARQAGNTAVTDPYLARAGGGAATATASPWS